MWKILAIFLILAIQSSCSQKRYLRYDKLPPVEDIIQPVRVITNDGETYISDNVDFTDSTITIINVSDDQIKTRFDSTFCLPIEIKYTDIESVEKIIALGQKQYTRAAVGAVVFALVILILTTVSRGS